MHQFPFEEEIILSDMNVSLRPLDMVDLESLLFFVNHEPDLFRYSLQPMRNRNELQEYIRHALSQRSRKLEYPFLVQDLKSGRVAGSTRFYMIDRKNLSLAIGYSWIGKDFQGSGLNRFMKFLMLSYVFDNLGFERVEFRADEMNYRSIRSLLSIGAVHEGVLRNHMYRADGLRRNTVIMGMLKDDFQKSRERFLH